MITSRGTRALVVLRLSHAQVGSVSIAVQRERCRAYCEAIGLTVVAEAVDEGVSGTLSPFERPSLRQWLSATPPRGYDVLVAYHLSRVSRSALDALTLVNWLHERGRWLVTVDDGVNTSAAFGRAIVGILASIADAERQAVIERAQATREHKRNSGYVVAGSGTIAYDIVQHTDGKRLTPSKYAPLIREVIDNILNGANFASQRRLIAQTTGRSWSLSSMKRLLTNPILWGAATHHGELVRDATGQVITLTDEPLITRAKFEQLQRVITSRTHTLDAPRNGSPLSYVTKCDVCKGHRVTAGKHPRRRLDCRNVECDGGSVLERIVFEVVDEYLRSKYPEDVELYDLDVEGAPEDIEDQIEDLTSRKLSLEEQIAHLLRERMRFPEVSEVYEQVVAEHRDALINVKRELQELEDRAANAGKLKRIDLGKTLFEVWPTTYDELISDDADADDIRFALAFTGVTPYVGASTGRGSKAQARARVRISDTDTIKWP